MDFGNGGFGFSSGGGGGSSANIIYKGPSPSTIAVGGTSPGYVLYNKSLQQIVADTYVPYINPSFASFLITGQTQIVEVGTTVSGSKSFAWSFNTLANVAANTMNIYDATGAVYLAQNISITSPYSVSVGTITNNSVTTYSWQGSAKNTQGSTFSSGLFSIGWEWREWWGTSTNVTLSASDIQALASSQLSAGFAGQYTFATNAYKYFVWDDALGSPTAGNGFKDHSTGFSIAMATVTDNAFYSNVQNGWYYGLVSVTQNGVTSNKRVYRTLNQLAGALVADVS